MSTAEPQEKKSPFFVFNFILCALGVLVILWFAVGVEHQNSRAQAMFEEMLKHSTPIILAMVGLMVFLLIVSYLGMKALKGSQREDKVK